MKVNAKVLAFGLFFLNIAFLTHADTPDKDPIFDEESDDMSDDESNHINAFDFLNHTLPHVTGMKGKLKTVAIETIMEATAQVKSDCTEGCKEALKFEKNVVDYIKQNIDDATTEETKDFKELFEFLLKNIERLRGVNSLEYEDLMHDIFSGKGGYDMEDEQFDSHEEL